MTLLEVGERFARIVLPDSFLESTEQRLRSANIALSGPEYCGVSIWISLAVAGGMVVNSLYLPFPLLPWPVYAAIGFFLSLLILTVAIPLYIIHRRIGELEDGLPDALRQMSAVLRAGVSMDAALEDVAQSEYGPLSEEFERTLAQVRRGRSIQGALEAMARRTRSELFERAFFLVVEGMRKGAELASVLEAVSNDIREIHAIQRERRATTMQQVLFLLVVALFAAPFICSLTLKIGGMFSGVSMGGAAGLGGVGGVPDVINLVVPAYVVIQAAITALGVGVVRYGEMSKGVAFAGPFMGIALLVYYLTGMLSTFLLPV
ncbi:hypothetical protein AKJ41_01535 [candidate division MSBL1 archaeon SCGC-AAA259O05]|uniref:Type II secretion system protein GspF domain-containing protein n=1 Tax=candidate division MSBL1 archaeon SCGC-AAA259O05 TaxID=1698271 RepID=A0A133V4T2_9EURY|nr:hypothetical protein AKJ41_01535 [candidate division MSBL1 archaeon SCGC-AAA259O05]